MKIQPEHRLVRAATRDEIGSAPLRRTARHAPQMFGDIDALAVQAERCNSTLHQSGKRFVSRAGRESRVDRHHPRKIVDRADGGVLDLGETVGERRAGLAMAWRWRNHL